MTDLKAYYRKSLANRIGVLESLRDGLAEGDPEGLKAARGIAHTLKGTGTSYGFPEVTHAARAVLTASSDRAATALEALLETLRRVVRGDQGDGTSTRPPGSEDGVR